MRKIIFFHSFIFISLLAESQLQFAGTFPFSAKGDGTVFSIRNNGTISKLHEFPVVEPKNGMNVIFPISEGPDGRIYGLTNEGGANYQGAVYAMNADGSDLTVLYSCPAGGSIAETKPAFGPDGKLYTIISGMISSMNLDGSEFSSIVPVPHSYSLQIDNNGWIYGASSNASNTQNFIYKVKTDGTGYSVLYTLIPATEGYGYTKGLALTPTGRLFGINNWGGANSGGTLVSIRTDGTGFTVHKAFGGPFPNGGTNSVCLPLYKDGKIWGTTIAGGTATGVIFSFDTASLSYNIIYNSASGFLSGLTAGPDGSLYSVTATTPTGIFRIDPDGQNYEEIYYSLPGGNGRPATSKEVVYHSATDRILTVTSVDISLPNSGVVSMDNNGHNAESIHVFGNSTGGNKPRGLIKDAVNRLYGVTPTGGIYGGGTIFSMQYDGNGFTKLYDIGELEGRFPLGRLLLASDGKLYGLCANAITGTIGGGIYRINTDGTDFEVVKQFSPTTDGHVREGNLVEGPSGQLFGIMDGVGSFSSSVYSIQKDGSGFTILRNISSSEGSTAPDGLIIAGGFLYGTFSSGGSGIGGSIFRIAFDGSGYEVIRTMSRFNADGYGIACGLTAASNGKLYGVSSFGGANAGGTIFSMNPDGSAFTVLHNFDPATTGYSVRAKLIEGSDGKLYSMTRIGGANGLGTFFSIGPDGTEFTVLKQLDDSGGQWLAEALVEIPLFNLPVKLNYFVAREKDRKVIVRWETSEEENSDKFIVERSGDGSNFLPVTKLQAVGNASTLTSYSIEDSHPFQGKNYYRLKMIDKNGSFEYSIIRLVDLTRTNEPLIIYPNPSDDKLTVRVGSEFSDKNLSLSIIDVSGRIVRKNVVTNSGNIDVDIRELAKGLYTVSITDGVQVRSQILIKK